MEGCMERGGDDVESGGDDREMGDGFEIGTERGDVAYGGSTSVWASIASSELRSRLGNDEYIYSSVPLVISTNIASCAIDGMRSLRATYSLECCFNT